MKITIEPQARWTLENYCDARHPNEIGGILLGRSNSTNPVVTEVFPIMNNSNTPISTYVAAEGWRPVVEHFARSHGLQMVGDFHSHPNGTIPSEQDMRAYQNELGLWVIHHARGQHTYQASNNLIHMEVELAAEPAQETKRMRLQGDSLSLGEVFVGRDGRLQAQSAVFALLQASDKTRLCFIGALRIQRGGYVILNDLAEELNLSRPIVRKHLKPLEKFKVVTLEKGGCKINYLR